MEGKMPSCIFKCFFLAIYSYQLEFCVPPFAEGEKTKGDLRKPKGRGK